MRRWMVVISAISVAAIGVKRSSARANDVVVRTITYPATGEQIRIERDPFGVPHIHAASDVAASYGVGVAQGEDKLWLAHLLRIVALGRSADLLGPEPSLTASDHTYRLLGYTDAERNRQFDRLPYDVQAEMRAYLAGLNAAIDDANGNPAKMPLEFVQFGMVPIEHWTVADSMALWDFIIMSSGDGGNADLNQGALRNRLEAAYGPETGRAMFDDLVRAENPDAPVTIPREVDWKRNPLLAQADALARRNLSPDARLSLGQPTGSATGPASLALPSLAHLGSPGLEAAAAADREVNGVLAEAPFRKLFGSNAQLVGPRLSEHKNALLTGGPQVDYTVPAVYWEYGVHVPGHADFVGITAPGALYPAIGRGLGYAWTVTNGYSDVNDTYVEHLDPADPRRYLFNGEYEPMDCRIETHTSRGVPYESQEVCRTRHGPVISRDDAHGVAYTRRIAHWSREEETMVAFRGFGRARSIVDFANAAVTTSGNWNVFYGDDRGNTGYWHTGYHPRRPGGDDIRLVREGTGGEEWQGLLPMQEVPHLTNAGRVWLASWNNTPAADWPRNRADGPLHRVLRLDAAFQHVPVTDPRGGLVNPDAVWGPGELVANLRRAAHAELGDNMRAILPRRELLESDLARQALDIVNAWDGVAYDADDDGRYDSPGVTIMRRWIDTAYITVFSDDLGAELSWARPEDIWHVLSPGSTAEMHFDWLNGEPPSALSARTFESAIEALAAGQGPDPQQWSTARRNTKYIHYNTQLMGDAIDATGCPDPIGTKCLAGHRDALPVRLPGYVPPHQYMNRGVFNEVIAYLEPARPHTTPGQVPALACSVLTPGNSGFVSATGKESPHLQDQRQLYIDWRFKLLPLRPREIEAALAGTPCPLPESGA